MNDHVSVPALPCFCASIRRASRVLTQLYEQSLRPAGLRATQFTILQALSLAGELSQGQLGQVLGIDSTTLTRNLRVMRRHGWIEERRPAADRRERRLRLAEAGRRQFDRALPRWQSAQAKLRRLLGARWHTLLQVSDEITNAVTGFTGH